MSDLIQIEAESLSLRRAPDLRATAKVCAISLAAYAGLLTAMAAIVVSAPVVLRGLIGTGERPLELVLLAADDEPDESELEILVMPREVQISKQRFVHRLTTEPVESIDTPKLDSAKIARRLDSRKRPAAKPPRDAGRATPPARPTAKPKGHARRTLKLTLPSFKGNRPPMYPLRALRAGWQGTTLLRVRVERDGRVSMVEILKSSGYGVLDAEAVRTVRTWRAKPARRGKQPVAITVRVPVRFRTG